VRVARPPAQGLIARTEVPLEGCWESGILGLMSGRRGTVFIQWQWDDPRFRTGPVTWWGSWETGDSDNPQVSCDELTDPDQVVAWGRERADRVVVHGRDGLIYWAGAADMPDGVEGQWESAPQSAR
jgi:hypothetical protein